MQRRLGHIDLAVMRFTDRQHRVVLGNDDQLRCKLEAVAAFAQHTLTQIKIRITEADRIPA